MHTYKRWVIITAAVFLSITASAVNAAHLYYMAALLLVLPLVSYILGLFSLRGLHIQREAPENGWAGENIELKLTVNNKSRIPKLFLRASDHLPTWLSRAEDTIPYFNVSANGQTQLAYGVEIRKRGVHTIDSLQVDAMDPLGIFWFSRRYDVRTEIVAYPVPKPLPPLILTGADRHGYRELPIAAVRGGGIDPDGVREYVPGDPMRRVHWRSTARTGRLNVVEFEEAHALTAVLVLDTTQGWNVGPDAKTTFECLVDVTASVAHEAIRQGASIRLVNGDSNDAAAGYGRGTEHLNAILARLARADSARVMPLSAELRVRAGTLRPGTTLYVFSASLDRDLPAILADYSATGIEVVIYYANPLDFNPRVTLFHSGDQQSYVESLMAISGCVHFVRYNEHGEISVETIALAARYHNYAS